MVHRDYIEEIRNLLSNSTDVNVIDNKKCDEIEETLRRFYSETEDCECLNLLGELLVYKIELEKKKCLAIVHEGMMFDPNNKGLHKLELKLRSGINYDFHMKSEFEAIDACRDFIDKHPMAYNGRINLITLLIKDYRFDEACDEINMSYPLAGVHKSELDALRGEIEFRKGRRFEAERIWNDIIVQNGTSPGAYSCVGDKYAAFAIYDAALECYMKAFELDKAPRDINVLKNILKINEIQENYLEGIKTINKILEVYSIDYKMYDSMELVQYLEKRTCFESKL